MVKPELKARVRAPTCCSVSPHALDRPPHLRHREPSSAPPALGSRLGLAALLSGTSPGQLAFRWPTLGKKKVGFGRRASGLCVTAQLGHLWDKKMQTTVLAEKSENPAVE